MLIWLPLKRSVFLRPLCMHLWRVLLDGGHPLDSTGAWVWTRENLRIQDICRLDRTFFGELTSQKFTLISQRCIQGVLLFLVLVCNKQVLRTLCRNRCRYRYTNLLNNGFKMKRAFDTLAQKVCSYNLSFPFVIQVVKSLFKRFLQMAEFRGTSRNGGDSSQWSVNCFI